MPPNRYGPVYALPQIWNCLCLPTDMGLSMPPHRLWACLPTTWPAKPPPRLCVHSGDDCGVDDGYVDVDVDGDDDDDDDAVMLLLVTMVMITW